MWHDSLYDLTPVQKIGHIWWKREDLFSPDGQHNGSKFRQLIWLFARKKYSGVSSGAVTGSPQLPMVAACARHYGMKCFQFTGSRKNMALSGEALGAKTILVNPGYAPLLNNKAQVYAAQRKYLHIETNITESKDVEAFHRVGSHQVQNIPDHIETLMVPAGSRNSVTSILYGLLRYPKPNLQRIFLFNIAPALEKKERWMQARLDLIQPGWQEHLPEITTYDLVGTGYTTYADLMPCSFRELIFHPRYEGKIWSYVQDNLRGFNPLLNDKCLFWIIGSEPKC